MPSASIEKDAAEGHRASLADSPGAPFEFRLDRCDRLDARNVETALSSGCKLYADNHTVRRRAPDWG